MVVSLAAAGAGAVEILAATGVADPAHPRPHMLRQRLDPHTVRSYAESYEWLVPGWLCVEPPASWADDWAADPDEFTP